MSAHPKKHCVNCGHPMMVHAALPHGRGCCTLEGCDCGQYQVDAPLSPALVDAAGVSALAHLRLSIGALRDVEKGNDECKGTSAAYWRQKLETIADLLEGDLK